MSPNTLFSPQHVPPHLPQKLVNESEKIPCTAHEYSFYRAIHIQMYNLRRFSCSVPLVIKKWSPKLFTLIAHFPNQQRCWTNFSYQDLCHSPCFGMHEYSLHSIFLSKRCQSPSALSFIDDSTKLTAFAHCTLVEFIWYKLPLHSAIVTTSQS